MISQIIRTLVAGIVAFFFSRYIASEQSYWIVLSAVFFVQIRVGYRLSSHLVSELITGVLTAIGIFVVAHIRENPYGLAVILSLISGISVYVGFRQAKLFWPAFLGNLLVIFSSGMPVGIFVLYGLLIAMLVTMIICPSSLKNQTKQAIKTGWALSEKLFRVIFTVYIDQDYATQHFFYEKKIYYLSQLFFNKAILLHRLNQSNDKKVIQMNRIFEIIMGLGSLRYRVDDHFNFEIISQELKDLLIVFLAKFNAKKSEDSIENIIDRLEEVYRGALQIAAKEPLGFLFFISELRALDHELST